MVRARMFTKRTAQKQMGRDGAFDIVVHHRVCSSWITLS